MLLIYPREECEPKDVVDQKGFNSTDFTSANAKVECVDVGGEGKEYVLHNEHIAVTLLNYGATVRKIELYKDGKVYRDVVLGFDHCQGYIENELYLGCVCGPLANRTAGAQFTRNGNTVKLEANDGQNHLHGGKDGCSKRYWVSGVSGDGGVVFDLLYPLTSDTGLSSTLCVRVIYRLVRQRDLLIHYQAFYLHPQTGIEPGTTTSPGFLPQPVNLTNHTYFNLNGHRSGPVYDHLVKIEADSYTPVDKQSRIPTGEVRPVGDSKELELDFKSYRSLSSTVTPNPLEWLDNNFILRGLTETGKRKYLLPLAASVFCEASGVGLECYTDQPCLQLYTSNYIREVEGKAQAHYGHHHALCLETQHYPDAVNQPAFPNIYINEDEVMKSSTVYSFHLLTSTDQLDSA